MQIDILELNGVAVVRPAGARVDLQVAGEFRTTLLQQIEGGQHRLVVDMRDVHFVDSSGLGALVSALRAVKRLKADGDIRLANVQAPVVALLEIIRLHRVFSSYASIEHAVESFSPGTR